MHVGVQVVKVPSSLVHTQERKLDEHEKEYEICMSSMGNIGKYVGTCVSINIIHNTHLRLCTYRRINFNMYRVHAHA